MKRKEKKHGNQKKQKTNSTHKSVALKVTKERIKNLSKFSSIEIKELKENNIILGTKVEFKIPLKSSSEFIFFKLGKCNSKDLRF